MARFGRPFTLKVATQGSRASLLDGCDRAVATSHVLNPHSVDRVLVDAFSKNTEGNYYRNMLIITALSLKNFRCFRSQLTVDLTDSTYLVGANNSGKTAILTAIYCFFDSKVFSSEYLNKTELSAKKGDYNRSEIGITFDLSIIPGTARRARMTQKFGTKLEITKSFLYRVISNTVLVEYAVAKAKSVAFELLDPDVQDMLNGVSVSYIHPQEGAELLEKAQKKFKERLFNNWGRHASVADKLKTLQTEWTDLRKTANSYLSAALTENLKRIWPHSSTTVDLPEKIEDIVAVSDITFRSAPSLPEVSLTSQGTGAQSAILYQTHYILDSDRSLHRGLYFPIWLVEEPESFLHADIAAKLGEHLNSDDWLRSIQMVISTHSPIILAASRKNAAITRWVTVCNHSIESQKSTADIQDGDVKRISELMVDPNFDAYFAAAISDDLIFVEDEKAITKQRFRDAAIPVMDSPSGTSELKKFLTVYATAPHVLRKRAFFIIDHDKGLKDFNAYLSPSKLLKTLKGISLYGATDRIFLIVLPQGIAVEGLFAEFEDVLDECVGMLFKTNWELADSTPTKLSRAMGSLRRKQRPTTKSEARALIQNEQDVKDIFWAKVESSNYGISQDMKDALHGLLT